VGSDTDALIAAYWSYCRTRDENLFWAWQAVEAEGWHDPQLKWSLILRLLETAAADSEVGLVAAGPLEELLTMYGKDFIDRIETEAVTNPKLRDALSGVWLRGPLRPESNVIADRVDRILDRPVE
jgi:hypothetical protein